jgi:hypothetical protein
MSSILSFLRCCLPGYDLDSLQVTGTICDSHILGYSIEVAPTGTDNFVLMASGNSCVENGNLGIIDQPV